MSKKIILIIAFIALGKVIKSQDLIVKTDSSKIQSVITEISTECIKYTLFNYNNSPTITMARADVAYIIFKNGIVEYYNYREKKQPDHKITFDKYNLDGSRPVMIKNENEFKTYTRVVKNNERFYKHKNYLGFNHLSLLNSSLSFTYMRDCLKENLILHVPVTIGIDAPGITNSMYSGSYLSRYNKTTYNLMNYQVGVGLLFSPSLTERVNFLIGPSFSFAQYDMSTETVYQVYQPSQPNQIANATFKNDFTLFRQQYGGSLGFMARFSERLNMSFILSVGGKKDSYNEKDPYGIDHVNANSVYQRDKSANVLPYANFAWSIGYRF